jgi:uncharacterized protein (DUF1501 family)
MSEHGKRRETLRRRDFLVASASVGAGAALGLSLASSTPRAGAQAKKAKKLIVVLNSGGWDTTYALDPKPGSSDVDTPEGTLQTFGDLPILTHASRPAVTDFFTRYADVTAVVNGLQVRSFIHPDCMKRVLTGSPSETTPDMAAIAAFELGRELPVPYLALGGQARSGPYAAVTGRTGTTNQLSALVDDGAAYAGLSGQKEPALAPNDAERKLVRAYLDASAARLRATRGQRGYNRARIEDYSASLDRAQRLRAFAQQNGIGARDYTLDLGVQIPLAVRALEQGLSFATLMQTNDWDTHQNNARQSDKHQQLFTALSTLVDTLQTRQLFDETLVVVLSEMGRTPKLNKDMGKDHWPVTSALLLGAGVRGNRVLGATSDTLDAQSIDLATGAPTAGGNGKQLQAANFVAGVLEAVGVDAAAYLPGVEPFRALTA